MPDKIFRYIVLHQSCRNNVGVAASQTAHAVSDVGGAIGPVAFENENVCVLMAEKADDLEALALRLAHAGIRHALIKEPDAPYFGAATAVGVEPLPRRLVRHLMVDGAGQPFPLLTSP